MSDHPYIFYGKKVVKKLSTNPLKDALKAKESRLSEATVPNVAVPDAEVAKERVYRMEKADKAFEEMKAIGIEIKEAYHTLMGLKK